MFHTPAGRQREVAREGNLLWLKEPRSKKNHTVAKNLKLYAVGTGLLLEPVSGIHRGEKKKKGCNSETSAQIALKMKFGKEEVLIIKEKGKIKFISIQASERSDSSGTKEKWL